MDKCRNGSPGNPTTLNWKIIRTALSVMPLLVSFLITSGYSQTYDAEAELKYRADTSKEYFLNEQQLSEGTAEFDECVE